MKQGAIEFVATVYKVQTLIDGGLRLTLDLPETAIAEAAALMECKRQETPLKIKVTVLPGLTNGKKQTDTRTARNPFGVVSR